MRLIHLVVYVCYISNGIVPFEKYKKYEIFLFTAVLVNNSTLLFGLLAAFRKSTSIVYNAQITAATCGIIYQLSLKLLVHFNQKPFLNTTAKLCEDSKFDANDILTKVQTKVNTKFLPLLLAAFAITGIGFNTTFAHFIVKSEIHFDDPDFHVIPYLFQFSQINTFHEYLLVLSLQVIIFLPEVVAYFSTITYMRYVLASVEVHAEEIRNSAKGLIFFDKLQISRFRGPWRKRVNNIDESLLVENELKNLTKFQQYFCEYLENVLQVGEMVFNIIFWLVIFSFVFLILSIKASKDELEKGKILAVVITFMFVYYLLCYFGEVICRMNEDMLAAFYDIPWYHYTPHLRKYVLMLMIQAHREFRLQPMNMYTVNLDFYRQTMKIVYSISNLVWLEHDM